MWKLVGLLALAALFVDTNASVLNIGPECPTLSHDDQFYYILDASEPSISVTLTPWEGLEGFDVSDLECNVDYSAGATLTLVAGPCIITCSVSGCDEEFKYTIMVIDKSSCDVPAEVSNGQVNGASTVVPVDTEVTVSCNTNYAPSGGPGVCTRSEVFAENQGGSTEVGTDEPSVVGLAECNVLKCGKPAEGTNTVEVPITEGALNEDFFYQCRPNHVADGSLAVWCKLNENNEAEWIPSPAPSCSEIKCSAPSSVENAGSVIIDEGSIDGTYSYTCNDGFAASGDLTITCSLDDGGTTASWSPVAGSCDEIKCSAPSSVENAGSVIIDEGSIDGTYSYTCNDGFAASGDLTITCSLDDGGTTASWSPVAGSCDEIKCSAPSSVENAGSVIIDEGSIDGTYSYTCNDGFAASGDLTITCSLDDGGTTASWSPVAGSCDEIKCSAPSSVENAGSVIIDEGSIDGTYSYTCNDGFAASGDLTITCSLDDGGTTASWSPVAGSCDEIKCSAPSSVENAGSVIIDEGSIDGTYSYTCNDGFAASGDLTITCSLDDGGTTASWSPVAGSCDEIKCSAPSSVENAGSVIIDEGSIDGTYSYTCNDGFAASGDLTITCSLDDGGTTASWSPVAGSCDEIKCSAPSSVENAGSVIIDEGSIDGTYSYTCNDGFAASGDLTITCSLDDGGTTASWSPVAGSCDEPALTQRQEKPVCPEGFTFLADRETGQCVKYQPDNLPWEMHARRCKRSGGRLVVPVSAADLKAVLVYQATQTKEVVWYGPQAVAGDGVFRDLDQRPLIYNNFGESGDGNCAYVQLDGKLYVKDCCWNLRPAMCAIDLPGPKECNEVGGYELSNGRCYRLIDNEGSFEEQCRSCHRLNGQLAPALDEKQNEALTNFFLSKLPDGDNFEAWIGMHNMVDEHRLQSVDLRSSSFTAFAPSTDSASGRCVTVGREGWGKKCCFDRLRAVCELNLCDKGYVQVGNNCYKVVGSTNPGSTWEDNCRTCHRDEASLVSFSQASDVSDFLGYIGDTAGRYVGGSDLWIGCHDQATEGAFQTSSLQEFLFFGGVSRPSKNADAEDCCVLNEHGVSAACCYSCLRGVCSKPLNK
ncbi:sushi, von Willebrand factor type A, EGF and pentraxin domain-containing protein 1-like [Lytechinus variegatus]|uniref:sushi, von Willebrand factor type A, EGF and pentraxin domain-containing protein 1-like n=1 Tax=Lytechinus variegatus TaxID=7654 RepID=UPI001BB2828E|nr:sushi, von Willebrand factor type A, EGF and pentraxin domain-containing protein 1-like [Lytechinus variegatus]